MKIDYLSGAVLPSRQADSVHVMKMCQAFAENGHDVTLYAAGETDCFSYYGVKNCFKIVTVSMKGIKGLKGLLFARRMVKVLRQDSDLVYSRNLYASFFLRNSKHQQIFESHSLPDHYIQHYMMKKLFSRPSVKLVTISEALKRLLHESISNITVPVMVAHDGADPIDLKIPNNKRLQLGYVGSLNKGRGIDLIIKIAEKLQMCDFHIIGGEDDEVCYWRNQDFTENLIFHGHVEHGKLSSYFSDFDILLAPYQKDTSTGGGVVSTDWMSPLKLFEYMATGRVLICSDLPVLKEVITPDVNGLMAEADKVDLWIDEIKKCLIPAFRETLGEQAKADLVNKYSWRQRAKRVIF